MRIAHYLRTLLLGLGVISSWTALVVQFRDFLGAYGTLLHASSALTPNPLLTPCLYGSIAFLVAFIWSGALQLDPSQRSEIWLERLLLFGIAFAALVTGYECADYYGIFRFGVPIVCTPGVNPFLTPCFRGLIFFILAYAASRYRHRVII